MTHPLITVRQELQPFPHVHISGAVDCTIALRGATIMDWSHEGVPIIDGYQNYDELTGQDGVRSGVLAPYAGRIRDARYWLEGCEHDLKPGQEDRTIFHGFARETDFSLVRIDYQPGEVSLAFCADVQPDQVQGYPFRLRMQTIYKLTHNGVAVTIEASNLDSRPAPISVGWHPYFRIGSSVNNLILNVPASRALVLDETLSPDHEAGDKAIIDTKLDFRDPRVIGPTQLDTCYTDVRTDANGLDLVTLGTTESDERIDVWQRGGLVYAYTGDRLERDPRRSIAIESISHIPDAFNAPEHVPTARVAPGQSRIFRCGFAYSPRSA